MYLLQALSSVIIIQAPVDGPALIFRLNYECSGETLLKQV